MSWKIKAAMVTGTRGQALLMASGTMLQPPGQARMAKPICTWMAARCAVLRCAGLQLAMSTVWHNCAVLMSRA